MAAGRAVLVGIATRIADGAMLIGDLEARAGAGHVVTFVLLFDFAAGFVACLPAWGTLLGRGWALGLAASTLVVFVAPDLDAVTGAKWSPGPRSP